MRGVGRPGGPSAADLLLAAALLAGPVIVPSALAQEPPPAGPAAGPAGGNAVFLLLEQAGYWRAQNRPELALQALERALQARPQDPDLLVAATEAALHAGRRDQAEAWLARLRQAAPADPRVERIAAAIRSGVSDAARLTEAREAARAGRKAEAVQRYRELFRDGEVPAELAAEFYQTLAGTSLEGFREANAGLRRAAERAPEDWRLQLAYAQLLTYRETTRAGGIERLRRLARNPVVTTAARQAWRQALLWQGPSGETLEQVESYLADNPADPEIEAKLREARASLPDEGAQARLRGFEALNTRRGAEAERDFQAAIAFNPRDADALIGLAILRQQQRRVAEARGLFDQAVAAAPDRREEFRHALGLDAPAPGAVVSDALAARRALIRGDLDRADALARRAQRGQGGERIEAETILGQIALRREDAATAEARFREALALRPALPEALGGLYDALMQQGRFAEAEALQRETGFTPGPDQEARRAAGLREQAARAEDPAAALDLLRQAVAVAPGNAWTRLDLIRLLRRQGAAAESRQQERALAQLDGPEPAYATALLATEDDRPGDAVAALERVPARSRTADMTRLLARSRLEQEVGQLEEQARRGDAVARERLLGLARRPDPGGATAAAVVRALGRLRDGAGAAAAARLALAANPQATAAARIRLAGALLDAGRQEEAARLTGELGRDARLTEEERRQLAAVAAGSAIVQSDRLNARGEQAAAYERLRPALEAAPDSPPLNLALARLYLGAGQPEAAARIAEAVLARAPDSLEARGAAIDAALAQRDWSRARRLIQEGQAQHPEEPALLLQDARLARARGDSLRALQQLETAANRKLAQLRAAGAGPQAMLLARGLRPGGSAPGEGEIADPVAAQIARELAQVREETATTLEAGLGLRGRSGQAGLSRLGEVRTPVEASFPVPGLGGRATLRAEAVALTTGALTSDRSTRRDFGSNPLAGAGPMGAPRDGATGAALGLGYRLGGLSLDVGSTPLGFPRTAVVGGLEFAPALTDTLRLRLTGERRAVTDSLLSYAGQRDGLSGRSWGGVTRSGGRGQLELSLGPVTLYGGGGYAVLEGEGVASNNRLEAGGGLSWAVQRTPAEDLILGLDARYYAYDRNLRHFTLGQGGYFSPQSHVIATVNADWRRQIDDWRIEAGASLGWQRFRESASPVFPADAGLQAQLAAAAAADPTLATAYAGQSRSGIAGGLRGRLEYALSPQFRIGLTGRYERSGDWHEAAGLLYLRYRLDRPAAAGQADFRW